MNFRKILSLLLSLTIAVGLAACSSTGGGKSNGDQGEKVKLVFWNSGFSTVDENDKSKNKEDFYIFKAIQRFEEAHPNITVEVQDTPGGDPLFAKFQTASIAKNGPDLTILWSGNYMMKFKQFLEPLDDYLTDEDKSRLIGWDSVSDGFKAGNPVYGIPFGNDGTVVIFYNKKLFKQVGIDPDANRPQTADEFMAVMEKLKSAEIIPFTMASDGQFWQIPSWWIVQTITPEGVNQLVTGDRNFDDPQLVSIVEKWSEIYKNGYVSIGQDSQLFYQGKAAMMSAGNWAINDARKALGDDLGMMKVPNFGADVQISDGGVGGVGSAYVVPNYSKHKQEAVEFIRFLSSKEEQIERIKAGELAITVAKDVNVADYTQEPYIIQMQEWSNEPSTVFWPDNIYPAELSAEMAKLASVAFTGKMSAQDFMKSADKKRNEILSSNQ